jgi:hypothetical protein
MPISMSVGRVRTPEFRVNLEDVYLIEIEAETKAFSSDTVHCLLGYKITSHLKEECAEIESAVNASWELRRNDGEIVDQGTTEGQLGPGGAVTDHTVARDIGRFDGEAGRSYVLDVDVTSDGTQLNPGHPHLKVVAWPDDPATAFWGPRVLGATIILEAAGLVMLAISLFRRLANGGGPIPFGRTP